MPSLKSLKKDLQSLADPTRAKVSALFFKTGKGEYGQGDKFLGITVPKQRQVAKQYGNLALSDVSKLLDSEIHEHRLVGALILVQQFIKANQASQKKIYNFYLKNSKKINNWDLVDLSAPKVVGAFLFDRPRQDLYRLAKSSNLWQKRIAIVSTWAFIRKGDIKDVYKISELLLKDTHDLIHKATGWMLREAGKKDQKSLEKFLDKYATKMPRTMLRYSIEKFPESQRKSYLGKK